MGLKDRFHYFLHKNRKRTQHTNQRFWGNLTVLVFSDDGREEPASFLLNYFILIFLSFLFAFLPLLALGLYIQTHFHSENFSHKIEARHRLLEISMRLTIEKKQMIHTVQKQFQNFHEKFSSQKRYMLSELLSENTPALTKEKKKERMFRNKPGLHRSNYELEFLRPLKETMKDITARQMPFIFRPIWTRMMLYHATPRGWALLGGVGNVTSLYGPRRNPIEDGSEFHSGIDFAHTSGTPIIATAPGYAIRVVAASRNGYGKFVRIHHGFGFTSLYAHCKNVTVKEGDYIEKGQVIAYVGRTGRTTGDHLHYEIQIGLEKALNPLSYLELK